MRTPGKNQIVRELRRRQKMAFDDDAGFAADLIEKQAARIADLESRLPAISPSAAREGSPADGPGSQADSGVGSAGK